MSKKCIIIGASHAAAQLSTSLRQEGWDGDILIVGDEPHLPYHRPPLSKTFLAGDKTAVSLAIRPATFYEKNNITFLKGRVTRINRITQTLSLSDGQVLNYDKLALCMGSRVRKINLPGDELEGIHYLRSIADAEGIKKYVQKDKYAVIIGGGYIGLETAAALKALGMKVVVLEMAQRVLQRVTAPELSEFYTRIHTEEGVTIHTKMSVSTIVGETHVEKVVCADGAEFPADLVVIGVGILPNIELAEDAGINVSNGILVDEYCITNDPNIVAAGDCTNHFNNIYGRRIRLESVPNANEQGKTAAASLCGVNKQPNSLPWFWSDQYNLKLQIAGISQGYDKVLIRGDNLTARSFAAFYFKDEQLISAECVNRPQEFMLSKKIIAEKCAINPDRLVNESITVKELLQFVALIPKK
ncbi:MAG: 3-phenylpropionate/trans-cinnamate dioxygenase ferredoxin reductase subunit [Pseudohongiellaceae bacterium]|jgi:3-phenylpropionate/trans-cinnamate dioxygenase ferredoxin reductase subunit